MACDCLSCLRVCVYVIRREGIGERGAQGKGTLQIQPSNKDFCNVI